MKSFSTALESTLLDQVGMIGPLMYSSTIDVSYVVFKGIDFPTSVRKVYRLAKCNLRFMDKYSETV